MRAGDWEPSMNTGGRGPDNPKTHKELHVYMLLKEHVDVLTTLCILSKCD